METGPMIEAEGLAKHYGQTRALAGVGFAVPAGTILGLLGRTAPATPRWCGS